MDNGIGRDEVETFSITGESILDRVLWNLGLGVSPSYQLRLSIDHG
jgi:hypothetical protein